MNEREIFRRYSLALSLLPDETVAADLFMRSRSEAELRRAAQRWYARQGLPAPAFDGPLPQLDANQQALALHLARRAQRRRQSRVLLGVLFGALLLLAAFTLPPLLTAAPEGMVADPIFAGEPLYQSEEGARHRLSVYRAEAVPGAVTIWWELRGPRAGEMARTIQQDMLLPYANHAAVEATAHRKDRLLGRSVFTILNPLDRADLMLAVAGESQVLPIRLTMLEHDPAARRIEVGKELHSELRGPSITVERVRIGEHATTVTLRFPNPDSVRFPDIYADGQLLSRSGVWQPSRRDLTYEVVLQPLPPGAKQLQLTYKLDLVLSDSPILTLPAPDFFLEWKEEDGHVVAIFPAEVPPGFAPSAHFITKEGQYVQPQFSKSADHLWVLKAELLAWQVTNLGASLVPISASDLDHLYLYIPRAVPDPSVTVELR